MRVDFTNYHRYRGEFVGFRATREENAMIDRMARLAGMGKQEYILTRLLQKEVTVVRNPKVFRGMRGLLTEIRDELEALIKTQNTPEPELIELMVTVVDVLNRMA